MEERLRFISSVLIRTTSTSPRMPVFSRRRRSSQSIALLLIIARAPRRTSTRLRIPISNLTCCFVRCSSLSRLLTTVFHRGLTVTNRSGKFRWYSTVLLAPIPTWKDVFKDDDLCMLLLRTVLWCLTFLRLARRSSHPA